MVRAFIHGFKRLNRSFALAALPLAVALAYIPAMDAGYIWDDDSYVTANPTLALPGAEGVRRIWLEPRSSPQYYPVVFTTFWAERKLWGLQPAVSHLANILLHGINASLLLILLTRLGVPLAPLAAAVFALHPVQAESVAWIAERKNVLSTLFTLVAALCYLRPSLIEPETGEAAARRPTLSQCAWACAFAAFVLALLSKSVAATFPAAILIVLWWRRGGLRRGDVLPLLPFVAVGAAAGLFTSWLERTHVGAAGPLWDFTLIERLVIAGKNVWFYLGKAFLPHPLSFVYPRWEPHGFPAWHLLAPAGVAALALILWWGRRRIGRGPLAALLFFLVTVAPALGFVDFYPMHYSFVADHFQYLALLGPILLAVGGIDLALRRFFGPLITGGETRAAGVARVALLGLLLLLGIMTAARSASFSDEETLWRDTIAKNPSATLARANLGVLLAKQRRHREALAQFDEGLRLAPGSPDLLTNRGHALHALGRTSEAERMYREALDADPAFATAFVGLASLLVERGASAEALEHLERVLILKPGDVEALLFLGTLMAKNGRLDVAEKHFRRALAEDPGNATALYNLGLVHDARGETPQAMDAYRRALIIAPDLADAHNNLGVDLAALGRRGEAEAHFREALRVRPEYLEARRNLDQILQQPVTPP